MKIIDKKGRKDYYDYLSGIYGVDEKIVLDRRKSNRPPIVKGKVMLYICDWCYEGLYDGTTYHWGENLKLLGTVKKSNWKYWSNGRTDSYVSIPHPEKRSESIFVYIAPIKSDINREFDCPIMIAREPDRHRYTKLGKEEYSLYPKLKDMNVQSILPPKEIYLMLSEWLAPKDVQSPPITDKEKLESHGFDKTSFRK